MIGPTLSPLEKARITAAAELAAEGHEVRWRVAWRRVSYVAKAKQVQVLSAGNDRVFQALVRQGQAWYASEAARLAEEKRNGNGNNANGGRPSTAGGSSAIGDDERASGPSEGHNLSRGNGRRIALVCGGLQAEEPRSVLEADPPDQALG